MDQLGLIAPWRDESRAEAAENGDAWNVLRFDGITQFYPWRLEAARAYQAGRIPLWNPYAFAAEGGTPLLANSQSAPLYPLNLLFFAMPPGLVWYSFGLSTAVHLLLAAGGTYIFLRMLGLRRAACCLGALTYTLSGPVVTWLALPTFLAVSCWLPWLLLLIRAAYQAGDTREKRLAASGAGAVAGTSLLAGHLQIAFYALLAGGLFVLWHGVPALRTGNTKPLRWLGAVFGAGTIAVMLAMPQVLPAVELSRTSHRAAAGRPTSEGYKSYVANAVPSRHLVTTFIPDFFGNPNNRTLYWTTNNYAEWAMYIGIAPLLLMAFAVALPWKQNAGVVRERGYFAALAVLALLLAFGTPLNLLFYFLVPGYSQTGNPGRCLFLFAFAASALAALGLHALADDAIPLTSKRRAVFLAITGPALAAAIGASASAGFAAQNLPQVPFGALTDQVLPAIVKAIVVLLMAAVLLLVVPRLSAERQSLALAALLGLTTIDLFTFGYGYNPTGPSAEVYPVTPGIAFLQQNGRDARIGPINAQWSISADPPRDAVLPPNALTVYGLHDIAGYDSLFPGAARERVKSAMDGDDPAPPENGNMVFVKTPEAAIALGARYIVLPPTTERPDLGVPVYSGSDMTIYENRTAKPFETTAQKNYAPTSFRAGLFLGLSAVAALCAGMTASIRRSGAN